MAPMLKVTEEVPQEVKNFRTILRKTWKTSASFTAGKGTEGGKN